MRNRDQGFVLVCVLWVLAMLTIVTIGFGHRAMLDRRAAAYSLDHAQAMLMARAAVQRGIVEVRNKAFKDALKKRDVGVTHLGQPWARPKNMLKEGLYFDSVEGFEDDEVTYSIEDAERYIDVNGAPKKVLEEVDSLSRSALRRIWKRRTEGVHEDEGPAPFQAIEELRYLRGVKDDDWFGSRRKTGLRYLMSTVGGNRINLNTASAEVLGFVPDLGDRAIGQILDFRAGADGELGTGDDKGFKNVEELTEKTEIRGDAIEAVKKYCKFNSGYFRIKGIATRRGGTVRAACTAVVRISGEKADLVAWQEETIGS